MQTWRFVAIMGLAATIGFGAACKNQPQVNHPLVGQTRYLCCNLHYEKNEVTDNWYGVGNTIKVGTPIHIVEVRKRSVKFQADGHPEITLVQKYGDKVLGFDQYLDRIFVERNPVLRFGKKRDKLEQAVMDGKIVKGMTKDQVAMAVGYPPPHKTPSLDADNWTYWQTNFNTYIVWFVKDRVDRVQQ